MAHSMSIRFLNADVSCVRLGTRQSRLNIVIRDVNVEKGW